VGILAEAHGLRFAHCRGVRALGDGLGECLDNDLRPWSGELACQDRCGRDRARRLRAERGEDAGVSRSAICRRRRHAWLACRAFPPGLEEPLMGPLTFDVAHLLAGSIVLLSFVLLYQDRLPALINIFAIQSLVLSASVAWQALAQVAPHLLITAAIAF